jgi:hypothetical protein
MGLLVWLALDRAGPRPIVKTSLEQTLVGRWLRGGAWRELPFTLSPQEEKDLRVCERLRRKVRSSVNGKVEFTGAEVRQELEGLLRQSPRFFYAEYLLGLWLEMDGTTEASARYYRFALEHAPVTLVQRYEFEDGRPLARVSIQHLAVECNRVQNGSLNPNLNLQFYDLITDKDGCVRLPVYETVYRLSSASYPSGFEANFPELGWFEARGRVGLLPPVKVRASP